MYKLESVEKRKPFIETAECFKKYGKDWGKPSGCYHIDEEGMDFKQCIKCGRVVFEKENYCYFYYANGVGYLIRKLKEKKK